MSDTFYLLWAVYVAVNVIVYLLIRDEWEIMPPERGKDVFNIPWGRVQWLCAVTHNTLWMYAWARYKEWRE